jgi:hypothetical protein
MEESNTDKTSRRVCHYKKKEKHSFVQTSGVTRTVDSNTDHLEQSSV